MAGTAIQRVDVGTILGRTGKLVGEDILVVFALLVAFTGLGTLADLSGHNVNIVFNTAGVMAQYFVIRRLCERHELISRGSAGGFWSFFAAGFLSGLGIVLGLIVLIVPGIYLAARWSVCGVAVIAERRGPGEALTQSWRLTAEHVVAIVIATIIVYVPMVAAFGVAFGWSDNAGNLAAIPSALFNALLFTSMFVGWYFGVAVYSLVATDNTAALTRVFE